MNECCTNSQAALTSRLGFASDNEFVETEYYSWRQDEGYLHRNMCTWFSTVDVWWRGEKKGHCFLRKFRGNRSTKHHRPWKQASKQRKMKPALLLLRWITDKRYQVIDNNETTFQWPMRLPWSEKIVSQSGHARKACFTTSPRQRRVPRSRVAIRRCVALARRRGRCRWRTAVAWDCKGKRRKLFLRERSLAYTKEGAGVEARNRFIPAIS